MTSAVRRRRRRLLALRIALLFLFVGLVLMLLKSALPQGDSSALLINSLFVLVPAILVYFVIERLLSDIQRRNHYFAQLTDNIREVFWVGSADWSQVFYVSPAYETLWGRSRASLYAQPRSWLDAVHAEDIGQVLADIPKTLSHIGDVVEFSPYRILQPDGGVRWIKARAFPVYDEQGQVQSFAGIAEDITRLKNADRALEKNEKLYRTILNNAPLLICIKDQQGRIRFLNRQFDVLGAGSSTTLIGKTLSDIFPENIAHALRQNDMEAQQSAVPIVREEQVPHGDGALHTYLTSRFALRNEQDQVDGICAVSMDITERKQIEQALQNEKERAQIYLDLATVILIAIEADQTVSLINKTGCELLGFAEEDVIGKNWFDHFLPVSVRDELKQGFVQLLAGNGWDITHHENPVLARSGEERLIAWQNTVFFDDDGKFVRIFSSGTDITEQRRAENEASQLMRQLQQSQKMEAIGHLTGGIAHDFNNILTSVMGYTELAMLEAKKSDNKKLQNYLKNVTLSSERARDLVSQLLSFSRGVSTELKPVVLDKQVREFLSMLRATFPTSIRLRTEFDCADASINADVVQLNQVLMNLSINARDAMNGQGEILYQLHRSRDVTEECSSCHQVFSGDFIELVVSDTGDGIDESILSHIFDPFFTTKEVGKGTGMGLAMVHGIVHAHGGHILVRSSPHHGAVFRLLFPCGSQDIKQHLVKEQAGRYALDQAVLNIQGHVLLVDDEDMIIAYITELLQTYGIHVTTINSSHQALEKFMQHPDDYDLIISDQTMPELTGIELLARIRDVRPGIPVILMTGHSDQLQDNLAGLHIDGFMSKPLEQKKFLLTVSRLLQKQQ